MKIKNETKDFQLNDLSLVVTYDISYTDAITRYISKIKNVYLNVNGKLIDITDSIDKTNDWNMIWSILDGTTK